MKPQQNTSKSEPKEFQHGFQPIYYFSRAIGLWPFSITYSSNGTIKARVHLLDSLWFIVSICLYLTALYCACDNIKKHKSSKRKLLPISFDIFYEPNSESSIWTC